MACRAACQAQAQTPLSKSVRKMSIMSVNILLLVNVALEYRMNTPRGADENKILCL